MFRIIVGILLLSSVCLAQDIPQRPDRRPFDDKSVETKISREYGEITSTYGEPRMKRGIHYYHTGVDYSLPYGTPIRATGDGDVIKSEYTGDYGNLVVIKHEWVVGNFIITVFSYYGHLTTYDKDAMFDKKTNTVAKVKKGQIIGYCGATGYADGTHVHYELRNARGETIFNGTYQREKGIEEGRIK